MDDKTGKGSQAKKKVGRPAKNEKRKNMVRISLIYISFVKTF